MKKLLILSGLILINCLLCVGGEFTLYNITPRTPGFEVETAARAVDLYERTGVDLALYSLTLHPTGKPAIEKVKKAVESYRSFRKALEGTKVRPGILVQAILGHWPRVDKEIEGWARTIDSKGAEVRFCPLDPNFAQYITDMFTMLAKEKPAFIMTDDDVRGYSHNAECFCDRHVKMFNERRGTSYTSASLRAALKAARQDDPDYVAFLALQREMIENAVIKRAREAVDSVDPTIPGGICVAFEEHFLCAPLARAFAAKGQKPIMRVASGCYWERAGASRVPYNVCRTLAFAEYYRDSGIDLLGEADTCPHNLWSKSAVSFYSHLVNASFMGFKGAKTWYVNARKRDSVDPVSSKYTKILERNQGCLDALVVETECSEQMGISVPCFTSFPGWHLMGNTSQFFVEKENGGADVCIPFGVPFKVSKEFGKGMFILQTASEVERMTDDDLDRLFSGKVLVLRDAALALTTRGRSDLIGVDAKLNKLVFNTEKDFLTKTSMYRAPIKGFDVEMRPHSGARVLSSLGFKSLGSYEDVTPSAVIYRNKGNGTALTVSYSATLHYLTVFSESRKRWFVSLLDELGGGKMPFVAGHDQDALVWVRKKPNGSHLVMVENLNVEPIENLRLRVPDGQWCVELLSPGGVWKKIETVRCGEYLEVPVPIAYYATVVLRMSEVR